MRFSFLLLLTFVAIACKQEKVPSFSFNEKDYKYESSHYGDDKIKIGDEYINTTNPLQTFRRSYYDGKKVMSEHFFYNKKRLGPQRLYDTSGILLIEEIAYENFDTTGYVYDKEKLLLIKTSIQ